MNADPIIQLINEISNMAPINIPELEIPSNILSYPKYDATTLSRLYNQTNKNGIENSLREVQFNYVFDSDFILNIKNYLNTYPLLAKICLLQTIYKLFVLGPPILSHDIEAILSMLSTLIQASYEPLYLLLFQKLSMYSLQCNSFNWDEISLKSFVLFFLNSNKIDTSFFPYLLCLLRIVTHSNYPNIRMQLNAYFLSVFLDNKPILSEQNMAPLVQSIAFPENPLSESFFFLISSLSKHINNQEAQAILISSYEKTAERFFEIAKDFLPEITYVDYGPPPQFDVDQPRFLFQRITPTYNQHPLLPLVLITDFPCNISAESSKEKEKVAVFNDTYQFIEMGLFQSSSNCIKAFINKFQKMMLQLDKHEKLIPVFIRLISSPTSYQISNLNVFSPEKSVYFGIDPQIEKNRQKLIEAAIKCDRTFFCDLLSEFVDSPFLYSEIAHRILLQAENCNFNIFMLDDIINGLTNNWAKLQTIQYFFLNYLNNQKQNPTPQQLRLKQAIKEARNDLTLFIITLITDPKIGPILLDTPTIVQRLLSFSYEDGIEKVFIPIIFNTYRKAYSEDYHFSNMSSIAKFFSNVYQSFLLPNTIPLLQPYLSLLNKTFQNLFREKSICIKSFSLVFHEMLKLSIDSTVFDILKLCLEGDPSFGLYDYEFKVIAESGMFDFRLIGSNEMHTLSEKIFLKNPQLISIILCQKFEKSLSLETIIDRFQSYIDFSAFNAAVLHDADIELILLQKLGTDFSFTYNGFNISGIASSINHFLYTKIINLIFTIARLNPSTQFIKEVFNSQISYIWELFIGELSRSTMLPTQGYSICLGSISPPSEMTLISSIDHLTIEFTLLADTQFMKTTGKEIRLLEIYDQNQPNQCLYFSAYGSQAFWNYCNFGYKLMERLQSEITHYKFVFVPDLATKSTTINTFINGKRATKGSLPIITFDKNAKLMMQIGPNSSTICEFLSSSRFFTQNGNNQNNRPISIQVALMYSITVRCKIIPEKGDFRHKFKQSRNTDSETTETEERVQFFSNKLPSRLVDLAADLSIVRDLVSVLNDCSDNVSKYIFATLEILFSSIPILRNNFCYCTTLASMISKRFCTIDSFISCFSIFKSLGNGFVSQQFFEIVLFNIWLWQNSGKAFPYILDILKNVVVPQYPQLSHNQIERLLVQYRVLFFQNKNNLCQSSINGYALSDSLVQDNLISFLFLTADRLQLFTKLMTNTTIDQNEKDKEKTKAMFLDLITSIIIEGRQLNKEESRILIDFCVQAPNIEVKKSMLEIILTAAKRSKMVNASPICLYRLFLEKDPELICLAIAALIELSPDRMLEVIATIGLEIGSQASLIYKTVLEKLHMFPILVPFACSLAIELNDPMPLLSQINELLLSADSKSLWFIWPLIAAFKFSKLDSNHDILQFIIRSSLANPVGDQIEQLLESIIVMILIFKKYFQSKYNHILFTFLRFTQSALDPKLFSSLCLSPVIIHFDHVAKDDFLTYAYNNSIFYDQSEENQLKLESENIRTFDIQNIQDLQLFSQVNVTNIIVQCRVEINTNDTKNISKSNTHLKHQSLINLIDDSLSPPSVFYEFIKTIGKDKTSNFDSLQKQVEMQKEAISKRWVETLYLTITSINSSIKSAIQIQQRIHKPQTDRIQLLILAENERRKKILPNLDIYAKKRDWTLCNLCPLKIKPHGLPKDPVLLFPFGNRINSQNQTIEENVIYKCFYTTMKKSVNCSYIIENDLLKIYFPSSKLKTIRISHLNAKIHVKGGCYFLFSSNGNIHFIDFCDKVPEFINTIPLHTTPEEFQAMWLNNQISNLTYIISLNFFAGRFFRNPTYYPFVPFPTLLFTPENDCNVQDIQPPMVNVRLENSSISASQQIGPFVVPEVFCLPEFIGRTGDNTIHEKIKFVDDLRRNLESLTSSNYLPSWIDRTFGYKSSLMIFKKPHPQRMIRGASSAKISLTNQFEILIFAVCIHNKIDSPYPMILFVNTQLKPGFIQLNNGEVVQISVPNQCESKNSKSNTNDKIKRQNNEFQLFSDFFLFNNGFISFSSSGQYGVFIDCKGKQDFSCPYQRINVCNGYLIALDDPFNICCFDNFNFEDPFILSSPSRILKVAGNISLRMIVAWTIDGDLRIFSTSSKKEVAKFMLGPDFSVNDILIAYTSGDIILSSDNEFIVLTPNGSFICRGGKGGQKLKWVGERRGAEYITETTDNKVNLVEVQRPQLASPVQINGINLSVIAVDYATESDAIRIILEDGTMFQTGFPAIF